CRFPLAARPRRNRPTCGAPTRKQPERKHDASRNDAETWGGEGRRAEERHWDGVLQRRGSRQRRHRERHGAESDRRRHYPEWYVGRPEKTLRHRTEDENRDEESTATIGHDCPGQDHGDHSATCP